MLPNLDDAEVMKLVTALGTILAIAILVHDAAAQDKSPGGKADLRDQAIVLCGDGLTGGPCQMAREIMRLALSNLSPQIPDWRFVVIPESRWQQAADSFGVKRTTPAFSSLSIRTTYVEGNLLFADGRVDENLQRFTAASGLRRLVWVMAHEYGHIVCQTTDERKANAAAGHLIYGRRKVCR